MRSDECGWLPVATPRQARVWARQGLIILMAGLTSLPLGTIACLTVSFHAVSEGGILPDAIA